MNSRLVRQIAVSLLCAFSVFIFAGCKEVEEDDSFKTPKLPSTTVEVNKGGSVNLPDNFSLPTEVGTLSTGYTGSEIFGGFALMSTSKTSYFTTSGSITLNFQASLFRLKDKEYQPYSPDAEYRTTRVALYQKSGTDTIYIASAEIPADGEAYSAVYSGLDTAAEYRFVITYTEVSRARITGTFSASGVTTPPEAVVEEDDSTAQ